MRSKVIQALRNQTLRNPTKKPNFKKPDFKKLGFKKQDYRATFLDVVIMMHGQEVTFI